MHSIQHATEKLLRIFLPSLAIGTIWHELKCAEMAEYMFCSEPSLMNINYKLLIAIIGKMCHKYGSTQIKLHEVLHLYVFLLLFFFLFRGKHRTAKLIIAMWRLVMDAVL